VGVALRRPPSRGRRGSARRLEGLDPAKLDEILGLRARGLRSVAILPLGYRQEEGDWLAKLAKVRRPLDQFLTQV